MEHLLQHLLRGMQDLGEYLGIICGHLWKQRTRYFVPVATVALALFTPGGLKLRCFAVGSYLLLLGLCQVPYYLREFQALHRHNLRQRARGLLYLEHHLAGDAHGKAWVEQEAEKDEKAL